jgi:rubrerythrin
MEKENYDSVWDRVFGDADGQSSGDDLKTLREFMDDEASDGAYYRALAKKYPKSCKAFSEMAADEERHLRELRTAYFILTGNVYTPKVNPVQITSFTSSLRKQYLGEAEGAKAYTDAAGATKNPKLRDIYLSHARDETRHRDTLESMLQSALA